MSDRSHHRHHSHALLDTAAPSGREATRALALSLGVLGATAALQLLIVALSGSVALLGDSVHNFADALTAIPLGIAFVVGRRPPNARYTYGYGRAEDLAGIFIVAVIALSAAAAAWESIERLAHPRGVDQLGWVVAAGLVGFAANEAVALYRTRVGRRIGSAALVADGAHARSDGLTSLAVVAGAVGVASGWRSADAVVGLVITLAIAGVLWGAARDVYRRFMDSVDPSVVATVQEVLEGTAGVERVEAVRLRWVGHDLWAEAEVVSDCELSVAEAHEIAEEAHHRLLHQVAHLARATIHTSPCRHDWRDPHASTAHHFGGPR